MNLHGSDMARKFRVFRFPRKNGYFLLGRRFLYARGKLECIFILIGFSLSEEGVMDMDPAR